MTRYLAIAALFGAVGCGASSLEIHARAALASERVLTEARDQIRARRSDEAQAAMDAQRYREDAERARDAVDARFAPAVATYEAAREVHAAWIALILDASTGRPFDVGAAIRLATTLVRVFAELRAVALALGLELPDLGSTVNAALATGDDP